MSFRCRTHSIISISMSHGKVNWGRIRHAECVYCLGVRQQYLPRIRCGLVLADAALVIGVGVGASMNECYVEYVW